MRLSILVYMYSQISASNTKVWRSSKRGTYLYRSTPPPWQAIENLKVHGKHVWQDPGSAMKALFQLAVPRQFHGVLLQQFPPISVAVIEATCKWQPSRGGPWQRNTTPWQCIQRACHAGAWSWKLLWYFFVLPCHRHGCSMAVPMASCGATAEL